MSSDTDTPQTDALSAQYHSENTLYNYRWQGYESLARSLERELTMLKAKRIACPFCNPIYPPGFAAAAPAISTGETWQICTCGKSRRLGEPPVGCDRKDCPL